MRVRTRGMGLSSALPHAYSLLWSPSQFFSEAVWSSDGSRHADEPDPKWSYIETKLQSDRLSHLEYLRRESLRLRASVDIDTLVSLLVGRIEFRYIPERPEVQLVFERIWYDDVAPLVDIAVRDYLVTGIGGLALTPLGVYAIRPELSLAYPNWHRSEWIARLVIIPEAYLEDVLGKRGISLYRSYRQARVHDRSIRLDPKRENEPSYLLPLGLPAIEIYDGRSLSYYVNGRFVRSHPLGGRYGYFLLIGEERSIDEVSYSFNAMSGSYTDLEASYPHFTSIMDYIGMQRTTSYPEDWTEWGLELPIGMLERCVRSVYFGYNLYEAHEKLVESIMKEALKGRWAFYRFDMFDTDSAAFQEFESLFNAIGYNADDTYRVAKPVEFAGGVSLPELQVGLRELEQVLTSVTGVSPYMLGVVGVTRVASEVVASQQHTNVKLSVQQERVARMLDRFVRSYQFYLASLPPEHQRVYLEAMEVEGELRYVRVGELRSDIPSLSMIDEADYLDFFSRCRIELAYTGQLSLHERRQNYMQAVQLLGSVMQVLMQMGATYRLEPIVDRLLKDFGVDLREVKQPIQSVGPVMEPAGVPVEQKIDESAGLSAEMVIPLLQSGQVPVEELAQQLPPGVIDELEAMLRNEGAIP